VVTARYVRQVHLETWCEDEGIGNRPSRRGVEEEKDALGRREEEGGGRQDERRRHK
jgi:hypothetical protein